jgi:hypothetical protein
MTNHQVDIIRSGVKAGLLSKLAADDGLFDAMMKETGVGLYSGTLGGFGADLGVQALDKERKDIDLKRSLLTGMVSGIGGGLGGALGGSVAHNLGYPATSWEGLALSRLPIIAGAYGLSRAVSPETFVHSSPVQLGHKLLKHVS